MARDLSAGIAMDPAAAAELTALRERLDEAEQTLEAIRNGDVDAVVVGSPGGQLVYTLENADRPYRVLIEQMQEGAITLSDDGTILYCNQRFATLLGVERERLLGGSVSAVFAPDDVTAVLSLLRDTSREAHAHELTLLSSTGRTIPVNVSLVDLKVDEHLPRVICGVVTDLTHNRRRTEELAGANARLAAEIEERRRVEDSLRLALEAAGMGSWEMDLVTREARHSLGHDRIFGYDDPIENWSLKRAFAHFVAEDRDAVVRAFEDVQRIGHVAFEGRIHRAGDQALRWLDVRARTYYERGRAVRIAGVVADITEQRAVEEQLRQAQKMEAVGQLTGGIAHDFNNLLLVIGGSLDMLARRLPVDERTTRLLAAAKNGVTRGARLNHQLLAFSRRQDLQVEVVCIDELVPSFAHLLERAVGESVTIAIRHAPAAWRCRTDPNQLETAILNLAINARDAMPEGGTLTLATDNRTLDATAARRHGATPGDYVVVSVVDTGTGMTPEIIAHVFEPFFTTKAIGKGTGLGLSQVYGFAKQSEGFVTIDSTPGHGSSVSILLPRTHRLQSGSAGETAAADSSERGHGIVLLVEDDADVRATASAMLRDLGYTVCEASNGQAALETLDAGQAVDLVFSDVIMPNGMSGIELARELGRRPTSPRVLLTSGYTAQRIVPEELAGNLRLLRKPYTQPDLSRAVQDAMRAGTP